MSCPGFAPVQELSSEGYHSLPQVTPTWLTAPRT